MLKFVHYCALVLFFLAPAVFCEEQIEIYIRDDVYEDYLKFVDDRDVLAIKEFTSPYMRRDVADIVVLQKALALGGFNKTFKYIPGKVNFRNTKMLEKGELLLSFDSYWLVDAKLIAEKVFISDPVIEKGQYLAGIFASPDNKKVFSVSSIAHLSELTAVSTPKWQTDWHTLSKLPLKQLVQEDEWLSQARMVHMQWVDFMLMPLFNTPDGKYQLDKIQLQMVPNVAILLNDSRHFVISRSHPAGDAAFTALNIGLEKLKVSGQIQQIYRSAGFLVDPTKFRILNSNMPVN
jgi:hypothetical protein